MGGEKLIEMKNDDSSGAGVSSSSGKSILVRNTSERQITLTIEKVRGMISNAKKDVIKQTREEISNQVQMDKVSLITVFGLFASLITFLTIEFQFLKTICSLYSLVGFTFILFSLLLMFNLSLDYLVSSKFSDNKPNNKFNTLMAISIIILIVGVWSIYKGDEIKCREDKIYTKFAEEFNQRIKMNDDLILEQKRVIEMQQIEIIKIKNWLRIK